MSYEKKMRDLLGRLVSMSPEPPPYPEETPMATSPTPRSRPHPALVFVGAAALVAALAVPVILLTSGEDPLAGGTSTTSTTVGSSTSSTEGPTSTTLAPTSSTTSPATSTTALPTWQGIVYLYQTPENSFLGNPALVPIQLEVIDTSAQLNAEDPFTAALSAVGSELPPVLDNAIPSDVEILAIGESDDTLVVDMNEAFLDGGGGLTADVTMLNQLVYTLTQDDPGKQVVFTVNGEAVDTYGSEGMVLADPIDRDSFLTELGLIFLTEPIMEVENVYVVAGRSNTFEASLTVRVINTDTGEAIHEEPVQATCGSGCWGEFGLGVRSDLVVRGESSIQLFEYSAEDGTTMNNLITIPILESDFWRVTRG